MMTEGLRQTILETVTVLQNRFQRSLRTLKGQITSVSPSSMKNKAGTFYKVVNVLSSCKLKNINLIQ